MEIISSMAGWEFLLRYTHFLAGVCWIGVLWYFNFHPDAFSLAPSSVARPRAPSPGDLSPMHSGGFAGGAMFTFLSGWAMVMMKSP